VLTTPALQILKQVRPDVRVGIVVEPRFAAVFEGNPDVEILEPSISAVARFRPHLSINFHGGTRSIALTIASGALRRAGFQHFRAQRAYNVVMPRAQEVLGDERIVHTAEHLASAMFYLGAPMRNIPRARLFAEPWPAARRPYVLIHPFASAPEKAWAAERFVAVANHLHLHPVILCGPTDDPSPFANFEVLHNVPLARVKSLIAGASLFLGNDSGPAHMACALGIPQVVLFGPSDPRIWAPWKPVAAETLTARSMNDISVDQVERAVHHMRLAQV
jgi:ADP-heptose:LPS heptosyltransferase